MPAGLASVPDRDDLLRIGDRLALDLGAVSLFRSASGSTLSLCTLRFAPTLSPAMNQPYARSVSPACISAQTDAGRNP